MARGPIYSSDYRPGLSGHETFPLRYGWLKKAFDAVQRAEEEAVARPIFGDDAIAEFGVGRNMVSAIRHWAIAAGIIAEQGGAPATTPLGRTLFAKDGFDPFAEHPATLWLMHWQICSRPERTTWYWAFGYFSGSTFERDHLVKGITRLARELEWSRAAPATIRNDVACFVRTYAASGSKGLSHEEALESPLTELGLIKATGKRDGFRFVRGPKPSLGNGVFAAAVTDYWARHSPNTTTLSFEALAHEPGSPGRVFLLDENDVVDRLVALDAATGGELRWSETAGLKQVIRDPGFDFRDPFRFIDPDYETSKRRAAA